MSVKASLLFFYFPLSPKLWYRDAVGAVGVFVGLMSLGLLFVLTSPPLDPSKKEKSSLESRIRSTDHYKFLYSVCVASLVRLLSLNSFVKNVDFTSREGVTGLWSL